MARKRIAIIALIFLGTLCVSLGAYFGLKAWEEHKFLTRPPQKNGEEVLFHVNTGQPLSTIARNLKEQGVISSTTWFLRLAKREGKAGAIRAGSFQLSTGWTPRKVLLELTSTPGILTRIGFREGLNWWQVARIAEQADMGSFTEFEKVVQDQTLLKEYGILAPTAEGYLFPETYLLSPPTNNKAATMVRAMLDQFFRNAARIWPQGLPPHSILHQTVILASLVEKETGKASERRCIAGVFANRMQRKMLLQTDPTIIYGLGPQFDGNIKRSHLRDKKNPYNTYVYAGLPPGPICSPGLEALKAVLNPEKHNFIFFVAKGDGTHHFSATLAEHNRAVHKYQIRRNRNTYRSYDKQPPTAPQQP